MKQAAITFAVGAPAQGRMRIDGALCGLAKQIGRAERQYAAQNAPRRHFVDRQRRLASTAPDFLIGIGKERVAHLGEARAAIGAVVIRDSFNSKEFLLHDSPSIDQLWRTAFRRRFQAINRPIRISKMTMRTTTAAITVLTSLQQLAVASLKNATVSPNEASAPEAPAGSAGFGAISFSSHFSARYGNSFRNALSLTVARGYCGLSM